MLRRRLDARDRYSTPSFRCRGDFIMKRIRIVHRTSPTADLRWLRDFYGNSIAVLTFAEPSRELSVLSEVDVDLYYDNPIECLIEPTARSFPFQYAPEEQVELIPYRLPSYPYDGPALQKWLHDLYRPGQVVGTFGVDFA